MCTCNACLDPKKICSRNNFVNSIHIINPYINFILHGYTHGSIPHQTKTQKPGEHSPPANRGRDPPRLRGPKAMEARQITGSVDGRRRNPNHLPSVLSRANGYGTEFCCYLCTLTIINTLINTPIVHMLVATKEN
jgi:hypothetical protein